MTIKKEIPFVLQFEQDLLIEDGLYPRNSEDPYNTSNECYF